MFSNSFSGIIFKIKFTLCWKIKLWRSNILQELIFDWIDYILVYIAIIICCILTEPALHHKSTSSMYTRIIFSFTKLLLPLYTYSAIYACNFRQYSCVSFIKIDDIVCVLFFINKTSWWWKKIFLFSIFTH